MSDDIYRGFKWEMLKNKAKEQVYHTHIQTNTIAWAYAEIAGLSDAVKGKPKPIDWRQNLKEMEALAYKLIDNWDIRMCRDLIKVFPAILPKKYRDMMPTCEYDEKGNWILLYPRGE